jgi:hypothetical protein
MKLYVIFSSKVARSDLPEAYMHMQGGVKHPSSKPTMSLASEPGTNELQWCPLVPSHSQIQLERRSEATQIKRDNRLHGRQSTTVQLVLGSLGPNRVFEPWDE